MSRRTTTVLILLSSSVSLIAYLILHRNNFTIIAQWLRGGE
jgi:hypothetical protein